MARYKKYEEEKGFWSSFITVSVDKNGYGFGLDACSRSQRAPANSKSQPPSRNRNDDSFKTDAPKEAHELDVHRLEIRIREMEFNAENSLQRYTGLWQEHEASEQRSEKLEKSLAASKVEVSGLLQEVEASGRCNQELKKSLAASGLELEASKQQDQEELEESLEASRAGMQELKSSQERFTSLEENYVMLQECCEGLKQDLEVKKLSDMEASTIHQELETSLEASRQRNQKLEKSLAASQADVRCHSGLLQELEAKTQYNQEELEESLAASQALWQELRDTQEHCTSLRENHASVQERCAGLEEDLEEQKLLDIAISARNQELNEALEEQYERLLQDLEDRKSLESDAIKQEFKTSLEASTQRNQELEESLAANEAGKQELKATQEHYASLQEHCLGLLQDLENRMLSDIEVSTTSPRVQAEVRCHTLFQELEAANQRNQELETSLAASKATEVQCFSPVTQELEAIEHDILKHRNHELEKSLAASKADVQHMHCESSMIHANWEKHYSGLSQELEASKQRNQELEKSLQKLEATKQMLCETSKADAQRHTAVLQELAAAKQRNQELEKLLEASHTEAQELKATKQRNQELEKSLEASHTEAQELKATKQRNQELEKSLRTLEATKLDSKVDAQRHTAVLQELAAAKQRNQELEKSLAASRASVQRYTGLVAELEATKLRNQEFEKSVAAGQDEVQRLTALLQEYEAMKTRNQELEKMVEACQAYMQELEKGNSMGPMASEDHDVAFFQEPAQKRLVASQADEQKLKSTLQHTQTLSLQQLKSTPCKHSSQEFSDIEREALSLQLEVESLEADTAKKDSRISYLTEALASAEESFEPSLKVPAKIQGLLGPPLSNTRRRFNLPPRQFTGAVLKPAVSESTEKTLTFGPPLQNDLTVPKRCSLPYQVNR